MAVNVDEAEKEFSNLAEEIRHETNAHVDAEKVKHQSYYFI